MSLSTSSTNIAIRQFQSEADLMRETREPRSISLALWLLAGALFSTAAVTFLIPVDRVVASTGGQIVPSEDASVFQALDASIIKSINVKEGQTVEAGQLLATLDPTFAAADVDQLRQQVASLTAQIERDQAEVSKTPFNPVIKQGDAVASYMELQKNLYDKRQAQYAADIRSFDEKLKLQQTTITKLQTDEARYQEREKISQQVQDMRDTLYKSGSSSLLNLLTATDQRLEIQRTMEFGHNSLIEAQHQISSLSADRDSYIQKWFSDASQDLVTQRNNLDTAVASLEKATKHQDLVRLTASEPGVVLTIAKLSVGSVLKEGDQLMTVMPLRAQAEVEAQVASRDVGFLRPGDDATIKIDAFNSSEHGTAEGKVKWVSEGAFTLDNNNQPIDPYYKVRISVDSMHFVGVPANFRLIPGMTLTADINVGRRSLAMYLIGGGIRGLGEAMREP